MSLSGGLYVVVKKNPYKKLGTFVRRFDDGYEEAIVDSPNGKIELLGYTGIVLDHKTLGPYLMKIQRWGLDMGSARVDRRRAMNE